MFVKFAFENVNYDTSIWSLHEGVLGIFCVMYDL